MCGAAFGAADTLVMKPAYGKEARTVIDILNQNHFSKILLNDSLASVILDKYIEALDPGKTYFLKSDINSFAKYRTTLDDMARREDVSPAFDIFKLYCKRFKERQQYVMDTLIGRKYEFTKEEYYETDRKGAPWCESRKDINSLWETIIKSQVLGDILISKPDSTIIKNLKSRYKYLDKTLSKINGEDVFGIYMNAITESYDPHTNYLTPSAANRFNESMSLSLEGIGAQLQMDGENVKVLAVISGGPADKSKKLFSSDLIIGVGQNETGEMVNVQGWRLDDVVKVIKG
ncbi:MAG: tail-specific protease, partial [Candidatus Nephrothrix sp. EaCA]